MYNFEVSQMIFRFETIILFFLEFFIVWSFSILEIVRMSSSLAIYKLDFPSFLNEKLHFSLTVNRYLLLNLFQFNTPFEQN